MSVYTNRFRELSRRAQAGIAALVLTIGAVVPALVSGTAMAAPALLNRQLETSTARPTASSVTLKWTFSTTAQVANIDHIEIEFCDSPLGACTAPNGATADPTGVGSTDNIPLLPASPTATLTNFTSGGNTASRVGGDAGGTSNQILIDKTTADAGASLSGATIEIGGFTNDDVPNRSYYTRVRLYSDNGVTLAWEGVFAQSTSQTLTVNARVQERLDFCVGSTTVDDATTPVGASCANITGSTVDVGNVESSFVNVSPVQTTNGGSNTNGVAMVRTNAVNGAVVDYKAVQNNGSGSLKVAGSTCGSTDFVTGVGTDQCFNSVGTTKSAITAGTEAFGMTIAGVNCGSSTAYVCDFLTSGGGGVAGTDYNLVRDSAYDGTGAGTYLGDIDQVATNTVGTYAWDDTGTADRIASSAGSTVKVIDDEALILKFAATAGITTPTGAYTVQADFIATATF